MLKSKLRFYKHCQFINIFYCCRYSKYGLKYLLNDQRSTNTLENDYFVYNVIRQIIIFNKSILCLTCL